MTLYAYWWNCFQRVTGPTTRLVNLLFRVPEWSYGCLSTSHYHRIIFHFPRFIVLLRPVLKMSKWARSRSIMSNFIPHCALNQSNENCLGAALGLFASIPMAIVHCACVSTHRITDYSWQDLHSVTVKFLASSSRLIIPLEIYHPDIDVDWEIYNRSCCIWIHQPLKSNCDMHILWVSMRKTRSTYKEY